MTEAYACINKNIEVRLSSSSGGMFSLLAESVIKEGGTIYAACYNDDLSVSHHPIKQLKDIQKARGAKYVFSRLGSCINDMKEELSAGKKVMFVGTPCQCAGVLKAVKDYRENALIVDFVCHGVPDEKTWKMYLDSMKRRGKNLSSVNMRNKETGWSKYGYCWEMVFSDNTRIYQKQSKNIYMRAFTNDLTLRDACYTCKYKGFERETDFTLADFWGVWEVLPTMDDNKGTSLVLVHSERAMRYFEDIQDLITAKKVAEEDAIKFNRSMVEPANKNRLYYKYKKQVEKGNDFIESVEKVLKYSCLKKLCRLKRVFYNGIYKVKRS